MNVNSVAPKQLALDKKKELKSDWKYMIYNKIFLIIFFPCFPRTEFAYGPGLMGDSVFKHKYGT
jgi:hypothetical protein